MADFAPSPVLLEQIATYAPEEGRAMVASIMGRGIAMGLDPTADNTLYIFGLLEGEAGKDASLIGNARYMAGWGDGCVTFRENQAGWN